MNFQSPMRSMTNSSIDTQALKKATPTAILTTSGTWLKGIVAMLVSFPAVLPRALTSLFVKVHCKSRGVLAFGVLNEDRRTGAQIRFPPLHDSLLRKRLKRMKGLLQSSSRCRSETLQARGRLMAPGRPGEF